MRIWFACSWITALACVRGLIRYQTAFLRTPKAPEGGSKWLRALAASRTESLIAVVVILSGVTMLIRSPGIATAVLAVLLAWQAAVYANAPLAGMAAEGIRLTPERDRFLRSPQTTGERAARFGVIAIPATAIAAVAGVVLAVLLTQPGSSSAPPSGPLLGPPSRTGVPALSQSPAPTATPSPTPSPQSTGTPTPVPTPTATGTPSPASTPGGAPTPRPTATP
jgi:hypothetical protein